MVKKKKQFTRQQIGMMAGGIPNFVVVPNSVIEGDGFYISYNKVDIAIYGCQTTALVVGDQMDYFYILNGDHREAYYPLIDQGLDACMEYFKANIDQISKFSDRPK